MPRDYVRNRPSSRANQKPRSHGGVVWLLAGIFIGLIIAGVYYVKNHPPSPLPLEKNNPVVPVPAVVNTADKNASTPEVGKSKPVSSSLHPANAASQNLQTQFDFYNVLPGKNVTGPSGDEDVSAVKPAASQASALSPSQAPQAAQKKSVTQTPNESNNDVNDNQTSESDTASPSAENDDTDTSSDENNSAAIKATQAKPKDTPPAQVLKSKGFVLQLGTFSQYADADKLKAQLVLLGFDVKSTTVVKNGKSFTRVWLGPFHTEDEASSVNEQLKENNISAKLLKSTA